MPQGRRCTVARIGRWGGTSRWQTTHVKNDESFMWLCLTMSISYGHAGPFVGNLEWIIRTPVLITQPGRQGQNRLKQQNAKKTSASCSSTCQTRSSSAWPSSSATPAISGPLLAPVDDSPMLSATLRLGRRVSASTYDMERRSQPQLIWHVFRSPSSACLCLRRTTSGK